MIRNYLKRNFWCLDRLLNDDQLPAEVRVRIMNILAAAALKDDVILVLHQDRKDHVLMNYAFEIDRHSPAEQEAIALFVRDLNVFLVAYLTVFFSDLGGEYV